LSRDHHTDLTGLVEEALDDLGPLGARNYGLAERSNWRSGRLNFAGATRGTAMLEATVLARELRLRSPRPEWRDARTRANRDIYVS